MAAGHLEVAAVEVAAVDANSSEQSGFIKDLPVFDFYEQIVNLVDTNQVTIITAETGAGKSTQIPQYLANHGYNRVIVTQPRILAARNLSRRVREEWALRTNEDSSDLVGYRTAHERDDSGNTQVLYCTDGLQLVREITGIGVREKQVLVLDEVHEWNENMEVLIAWAKKRCEEEPGFKIVIMSATIETGSLAEYFGTDAVVNVPGRTFEVKKRRGTDILSELFNQLQNPGRSILTFLPGKAEIQDTIEALKTKADEAGVPILPLHSQLELEDQQKAFATYDNGKIILSTNIAQTSVTIQDIDMVIDSGLERRSEVRNGVEGLFISQISQADIAQRAGRAGRTKPGEYVLAPYDIMPCLSIEERPEYATPEILRKHIDRLTLRLANVGIDIETLDFYHDPSKKSIQRAKRTLISLGALTNSGEVTAVGREMEQFPVESSYARMLVESTQYSQEVQAKLAAIIAIQEIGGITRGGSKNLGWKHLTKQSKSDLIAQYDVYLALPSILEEEYEDKGIIAKNVIKAQEVIERLHRNLGLQDVVLEKVDALEEEYLLRSIVAGQIDQLWSVGERGEVEHVFTKQKRELSSSTVVRNPKLVSGTPFDLQIPGRNGGLETLNLLQGVTVVKTEWLDELAPQLFMSKRGGVFYDPRLGTLAKRQQIRFGKKLLEGNSEPILEDTAQNRALFTKEYSKWAYERLERERRNLSRFHRAVPSISLKHVERAVKDVAVDIVSIDQLNSRDKRALLSIAKLETHLGDDFIAHLKPSRKEKHYRKERRWQPKPRRKFGRRDR